MARDLAYFETMRQRGARVILKDPMALLSADWLADRFGARVVVVDPPPRRLRRQPARRRLGPLPFEIFRDQPALMPDRLAPFAAEIAAAAETMPDAIDAGTLLWRVLHHHIDLLRREHPDWIFVRHEDLVARPRRRSSARCSPGSTSTSPSGAGPASPPSPSTPAARSSRLSLVPHAPGAPSARRRREPGQRSAPA